MIKNIAIIGGDLRIVKLVEILVNDGYTVYTYALEEAERKLYVPLSALFFIFSFYLLHFFLLSCIIIMKLVKTNCIHI